MGVGNDSQTAWYTPIFRWAITLFLIMVMILTGSLILKSKGQSAPLVGVFLPTLGALVVMAFWGELRKRSLKVSVAGFEVGAAEDEELARPKAPSETLPPTGGEDASIGVLRDILINLGRFYQYRPNPDHETALMFYLSAASIRPSVLAAFRSLQCAAHGHLADDIAFIGFYDSALWLAEHSPGKELVGREQFVKWIRARKEARRKDPNFVNLLREELEKADF